MSESEPKEEDEGIPGIAGALILEGWGIKGLLGHMWLHGGIFHLIGNMWFLLVFGNAVCAKIGNLRYLLMCIKGRRTIKRCEKPLLQMWQEFGNERND